LLDVLYYTSTHTLVHSSTNKIIDKLAILRICTSSVVSPVNGIGELLRASVEEGRSKGGGRLFPVLCQRPRASKGGVLLGSESDLVQHELGDGVGELGSHGQMVTLGLEAILVSHKLQFYEKSFRRSVTVME